MRRRIWSETLPHNELVEPRVIDLLARYRVSPIVAVWPSSSREIIARILDDFERAGLEVALWPMLDDTDGRWASAGNVGAFVDFVLRLVGELAQTGRRPREIAVDLEPAINEVRPYVSKQPSRAVVEPSFVEHAHYLPFVPDVVAFESATARLSALCEHLFDLRIRTFAAIVPILLLDPLGARPGSFQEILGTPVDEPAWDHVNVMAYSSIIEGWSKGLLRRSDACALLGESSRAARHRFGDRASISLGAVGPGAFGDEPTYRSSAELCEDVAIARAAGVDDLVLFDLGGVISRGDPEAWLEAFTRTEPSAHMPPSTLRVRAALSGARVAGRVLSALGRLKRAASSTSRGRA